MCLKITLTTIVSSNKHSIGNRNAQRYYLNIVNQTIVVIFDFAEFHEVQRSCKSEAQLWVSFSYHALLRKSGFYS